MYIVPAADEADITDATSAAGRQHVKVASIEAGKDGFLIAIDELLADREE